ncbi:hypothetical protein ACEPAI_1895 [Sanghuangporus weigelae]
MSGAGGTGSSLRPGYNDGSGSDPRFQSSSSTAASRRGPIDIDVESHAHVHPLSSAASSSSATHPPPALSAAPSANPGANTNNNASSKQSQSRSRMPAIGAHPSFYDPDAPSHPQPALDYATFMMHQQQQQAHHHAHHGQMGYAQGQGEYGIDAGGYGAYEGLEGMVDVNVGFGPFAPQHQSHHQHQQVYGHPSAHAQQQHAVHQQHHHQLNSVSPASASTQSLPSGGGGTPCAPPGAGSTGFFYEGYEHQGQAGQQQQFAHHGLPEQPFDVYFPPPSSSGAAGAGPGFDSFPSSAGTGTGTPPVPLWNSNVGEVSGIPETGQAQQMQGAGLSQRGQRGQAQKDWSRSTGTEPPGRTGRRGTVRPSLPPQQSPSTQQKQTQGQGPKQVHTPSSQDASTRRKRTKRTRTADASDGSDDDSEDELGAGGPTSANPAPNPLFGTSFPSWTHGPPAGSFPSGGAGGAPWSVPSDIPTLANLVGGQNARL